MRAYLHEVFPSLDQDDILQETMIALTKCLPRYQYLPDTKGHFRNYLIGILRHKANDAVKRRTREATLRSAFQKQADCLLKPKSDAEHAWKMSAMEVAIEQLVADQSINSFHRTVFREITLLHEDPAAVAEKYGTSRSNVDIIKMRMIARLKTLVSQMTKKV